jgi:hypothetical protein
MHDHRPSEPYAIPCNDTIERLARRSRQLLLPHFIPNNGKWRAVADEDGHYSFPRMPRPAARSNR